MPAAPKEAASAHKMKGSNAYEQMKYQLDDESDHFSGKPPGDLVSPESHMML